jgi:pyridinium-3,5-biscarboxylic acid mononucleotide sulfurtransferase
MESAPQTLAEKVAALHRILAGFQEGALVAFSGGADSALLAVEAGKVLGGRCVLFTADSPTLPRNELEAARAFAGRRGLRIEVRETREMEDPRFLANDAYRCYHCKGELFERMGDAAAELGLKWLLFGAIADDAGDWRPGMKAAFEKGGRAPLMEAGFTKQDVRDRSRELGLETWDKPSSACLSSRFPAGRPVTLDALRRVEKAEEALHSMGFRQCRVRLLDDAARVEVEPSELGRFADEALRKRLVETLKGLGFRFVTLDLEGFRSGSLNPGGPRISHQVVRGASETDREGT